MTSSRTVRHLAADEYVDWIGSPFVDSEIGAVDGTRAVVVHDAESSLVLPGPGALPVVVCAVGAASGDPGATAFDLVLGPDDVDGLMERIERAPRAAAALAVLLRSQEDRDRDAGLAAESAVYSMLQAGPEWERWRSEHPATPLPDESGVVAVDRHGGTLTIVLDRPHRHNAITSVLRDELAEALAVARLDDDVTAVELSGNGPSFCSGGDLDEFGSRSDPAAAHVTRLARSPAREVDRLGCVTARVHGSTVGGGIELAAFARRVVADPDTRFSLPELGLGLIPGAGGTVSLTRRIGRQRTAALALTCRTIDADTALAWGLVDEITPVRPGV